MINSSFLAQVSSQATHLACVTALRAQGSWDDFKSRTAVVAMCKYNNQPLHGFCKSGMFECELPQHIVNDTAAEPPYFDCKKINICGPWLAANQFVWLDWMNLTLLGWCKLSAWINQSVIKDTMSLLASKPLLIQGRKLWDTSARLVKRCCSYCQRLGLISPWGCGTLQWFR